VRISNRWKKLGDAGFSANGSFLATFRQPDQIDAKFAGWGPYDSTMRYFKFLFSEQIRKKDAAFFENYARLGETAVGNPTMLPGPSGEPINKDHFFAVEEHAFLDRHLGFGDVGRVVEIGGGFGRTAQAIVKLAPSVERYTIVDLPGMLSLSSLYLKKVLTAAEFAKLRFVDAIAWDAAGGEPLPADLAVNIDSFQDMPSEAIRIYFERIVERSQFFYSKNTVAKYRPETIGVRNADPLLVLDGCTTGWSTDVIDIFDQRELASASQKHVEQYRPAGSYEVLAAEPMGMFPYYLHVLYGRTVSS